MGVSLEFYAAHVKRGSSIIERAHAPTAQQASLDARGIHAPTSPCRRGARAPSAQRARLDARGLQRARLPLSGAWPPRTSRRGLTLAPRGLNLFWPMVSPCQALANLSAS